MKILESQMSLPDRMVANASVSELENQAAGKREYGTLETTAAAITQLTSINKWADPSKWGWDKEFNTQPYPEDFDPLEYVPDDMFNNGKLDHAWDKILNARNQAEVQSVVTEANAEAHRKHVIENGTGWGKFWGTTIGIFSSPEYYPGLLWNPSGGFVRTGIELGLITTAETAAHELNLQSIQVNRDPYESLANVGTAAIVGTVLGGGIGKFVKPNKNQVKNPFLGASREIGSEVDDIAKNGGYRNVEDLPDEIEVVGIGSTTGAAAEGMGAGAKPMRGLRWGSGFISLMRPLVKARVSSVHETLNKYFGHDFQIRANAKKVEKWDAEQGKMVETDEIEHQAKPTSLARQVDRETNQMLSESSKAIMNAFRKYVGHKGKSFIVARAKNRGQWEEFNKKLRYAVSNEDKAADPADVAITEAAGELRRIVYQPIERLARELDMIDTEMRKQLETNIQKISDRIGKVEDAAEIRLLTEELEAAQKSLDDFVDRVGDVKYADSYANRRLHRENIENNAAEFKAMLFERYKEIRQQTAWDNFKADRLDKIKTAKEFIAKRQAQLAKKLANEEKKLKRLEEKVYGSASPTVTAARKAERGKAYKALQKLKDDIKADKQIANREAKIEKLQDEIDMSKLDDFEIKSNEGLAEIRAEVAKSYQRVLNGELIGEIWQRGAHQAKNFKERQLPLTDNELLEHEFLHTNMLDQVKSYLNSTLRPLRMKEMAGDTEMAGVFKNVEDDYTIAVQRAEDAGKTELAKSLDQEKTLTINALELAKDRYYDRTNMYRGHAASAANVGRSIRNLNVMRMMGGVLTTSMNDVARLNAARIYMQSMKGKGPGLIAAFKTLKHGTTEEALRAAGFAAETIHMMRLTKMVDMGVPLMTGNQASKRMLNVTAIGAKGLMKATLLTQWTDFMKMMAATMTQNQTVLMMRNYAKLSKNEKTILAEMGIDESFAKTVMKEFDQHGDTFGKYGTSLNWDEWTDQVAAERMKDIMFRQSERILVTPNETTLPMVLGDNELGRAFLQLKSFSLAAHNQTTVPMIERAQSGDLMSIYAMAAMSVGAVPTEMVKMWEAGREDELKDYNAMDWGLAIADRSAIAPLLSMGFNMIDMTAGNRITTEFGANPPSRYSDRTVLGAFGPSFSTVGDMIRLTSGMVGGEIDNRDARALRRLMPFQNYMLLNRLANKTLPNQSRTQSDRKYVER